MMIRRTTILLTTLAALLTFAGPADAAPVTRTATSANWAGYAVSKPGVRFRRVAGSWVQPAASCTGGERRFSAYWVGVGGFHSTANALEQIGTQVDCSSKGEAFYSAWYEMVPAAPVTIHLKVHPGDTLSASVSVSKATNTVKLYIANRTRGTVFSKTVHAKQLDVTAAEWIVEAPSACDIAGCHTLPLANFGTASFTGAKATDSTGHAGAITDPAWSPTAIALSPSADGSYDSGLVSGSSSAAAAPSDLSASGDAFTVTYQPTSPSEPPPAPAQPAPAPGTVPVPVPVPPPVVAVPPPPATTPPPAPVPTPSLG